MRPAPGVPALREMLSLGLALDVVLPREACAGAETVNPVCSAPCHKCRYAASGRE